MWWVVKWYGEIGPSSDQTVDVILETFWLAANAALLFTIGRLSVNKLKRVLAFILGSLMCGLIVFCIVLKSSGGMIYNFSLVVPLIMIGAVLGTLASLTTPRWKVGSWKKGGHHVDGDYR